MATFVYHGCYIVHLAGSIHKNKGCTTFGQRTIVAARRFALTAFQVKVTKFFHLPKQPAKNGFNSSKH